MIKFFFDSISSDFSYHADRNRFGGYLKYRNIYNSKLEESDIIVIPNTSDLSKWANFKKGNKKIIFDIPDAYLVEPNSLKKQVRSVAKYVVGKYSRLNFSNISLIKKICSIADAVVCVSDEQRDLITEFCKNTHIIYDFQGERILNKKNEYNTNNEINLVWEGLPENLYSFKFLDQILYDINKTYDFNLNIITELTVNNYLRKTSTFKLAKEIFTKFNKYKIIEWNLDSLSKNISNSDIGIIPLDIKNKMNYYKGANKLILFWKIGIPVVTSSAPDLVRQMNEVKIKHYCENHTEWKNTLINLFENRMQIESLAKKVKNFAYKHFSEEKIATNWDDVINKII